MSSMIAPPVFEPFLKPARYKVAHGGRGSGKSWSIARLLIEIARRSSVRVLCARELQSSISDSVIQLLADTIERNGYLKEFDVLKTEIVHKHTRSRFMFYGIRHNITKIKSLEGVDVCWVEEAENVQRDSWDVLIPTIRKENSEIWVSFNAKNILDDTYQRFVVHKPYNAVVIKVNYTENPFFPETLRQEMEHCKKMDYELYRHIWEGEPVADSEQAIIKPVWVEASIDAHKRFEFNAAGDKQIGYDVADEGEDASAMFARIGSVATKTELWHRKPSEIVTKSVYNYCYLNDYDLLVYDSIGVGAAAKVIIKELNNEGSRSVRAIGFNAGGKVKNPKANYIKGTRKKNQDMFANIKAQEWWSLRQRFYNTYLALSENVEFRSEELISLPSDLENLDLLQAELSRPQVDYDRNGRVKVEAKIDMKKRGIPSTNLADAMVMSFSGAKRGSSGLIC